MDQSRRASTRSPTEILKAVSGFLTVATAVGAYFTDAIETALRWFELTVPAGMAKAMATGFAAAGALLVWQALRPRSRLLRPEALTIMPGRPEHLVGRDEDLEQLKRACTGNRLVFLIGESGSGKTALLRAGLVPSPPETFLPIYVDTWGEDWEFGAWRALGTALTGSVAAELRRTLGDLGRFDSDGLADYLRRLRILTGKRALIILDQFDDYISAHLPALISERIWISAAALQGKNSFWRAVAHVISAGDVHMVVTTRADAAACLDSVRFIETPVRFNLDRLRDTVVEPFLRQLTNAGTSEELVVSHPEAGWVQLQHRLAKELSRNGVVLAAQMRLAFAGLDTLNPLSVASFERIGAVRGLEAAHVRRHVAEAARIAGLSDRVLLGLLLHMVDQPRGKTTPRSLGELARGLDRSDTATEAQSATSIDLALQHLLRKHIVRQMPDPSRETAVYALAHDYLSGAVVDVHRGTNRWQRLLQEGDETFATGRGSLVRQWKALLTPTQSLMVAAQRLRGRLRYGPSRTYALLSVLRFVPALSVVAVVWLVWADRLTFQREAEQYVSALESDAEAQKILLVLGRDPAPLTEAEKRALWTITYSYEPRAAFSMKVAFLRNVMTSPESAARFVGRKAHLLTALWGADAALAHQICQHACWPAPSFEAQDLDFVQAQAVIGAALPQFDQTLFESVLTNLQFWQPDDAREIEAARHVARFAERADAVSAASAFNRLLADLKMSNRDLTVQHSAVLVALARCLSAENARRVWEQMHQRALAEVEVGRRRGQSAAGTTVPVLLAAASKIDTDYVRRTLDLVIDGKTTGTVGLARQRTRDLIYDTMWTSVTSLPEDDRGRYFERIVEWVAASSERMLTLESSFDARSFFAAAAAVASRVNPEYVDRGYQHCAKAPNWTYAASTLDRAANTERPISIRETCINSLAPHLGEAAADTELRELIPKRGYLMAALIAPRASGALAADVLKRALTSADTDFSTPLLLTLVSRISAASAAELLAARRQRGETDIEAIGSANYQRKWVIGALVGRRAALTPAEITELITDGSRQHGERRTAYGLALSGHVASVSPPEVPSAFDLVESTFLSGGTLTGPAGERDSAAVIARPLIAAMIALGERLERVQAREALARWFSALEGATAEEVTLYGPVLAAFVRPDDEELIFDLAKRPDFNALPPMQEAVLDALRKLLKYEGTGLWNAAREAARHRLDPVRAPPERWEYAMRLH